MGLKEFFAKRKQEKVEKLQRQFREAKVQRVVLKAEEGRQRKLEVKKRFIQKVRRQEFRQSSAGKTLVKLRKTASRVGRVGEASASQAKRFVQQQSRPGSVTRKGIRGLSREGAQALRGKIPKQRTPQQRMPPSSRPQTIRMFEPIPPAENDKKKKSGGLSLF
ncbi:MAG: hypothetical protein CMI54_08310 [Parcubacteria group bacterium]|nr:hypothetical protein [Parcubacteria group bacterium]|tara:strand:- start:2093 stop:2581 length:489 start_codon:yes stop_codon:yes gene_type:complete